MTIFYMAVAEMYNILHEYFLHHSKFVMSDVCEILQTREWFTALVIVIIMNK